MLHELLTHLTTPCPPHVRRLRYLYETIGLRARHRRHRRAWQPHLENSRAFVLAAADRCEHHGSVAVYGAGLLLDVPLAELAQRFDHVYLLDLVYLRETRRRARRHPNVTLVEHDATNVAAAFLDHVRHGRAGFPDATPAPPECVCRADLVVSLNLLSQLPVMPREYALDHVERLDMAQLDAWCARVIAAHHAMLRTLDGGVCLIADHSYVKRDRAGTIVDSGSTVHGLTLPEPDAAWTWPVAPLGESDRDTATELTVGAWHLR